MILFLLFILVAESVDLTTSETDIQRQLYQLEDFVKNFQSQTRIKEQKDAAAISSILSTLTSTKDELASTKNELQNVKTELSDLKLEHGSLKDQLTVAEVKMSNTSGTENRLLELEKTVADIRSQSKIQEQNYAAVLSNVLSHLASTTQDISTMKVNVTNLDYRSLHSEYKTQQKLNSQDKAIAGLKSESNASQVDIRSLKSDLNSSKTKCETEIKTMKNDTHKANADIKELTTRIGDAESEVRTCKTRVGKVDTDMLSLVVAQNSTCNEVKIVQLSLLDISTKQTSLESVLNATSKVVSQTKETVNTISQRSLDNSRKIQPILSSFYIRQIGVRMEGVVASSDGVAKKDATWKTSMSRGQYFNNTTGYFTAPVTGSYIFWVNAFAEFPNHDSSVTVYIRTGGGSAIGVAYGIVSERNTKTPVTGIGAAYLQQGSKVWFTPSVDVKFLPNVSRFGGVLL